MSKPQDYFRYSQKELSTEGVPLEKLAREFGTPLYVYSREAFLRPLRTLQQGLEEIRPLVCFAVKANSNLSVLRLLQEEGAGMDLVSLGEMKRAILAGTPVGRIVFSGVGKSDAEIEEALKHSIHSFNVESTAELARLSELAQKKGKVAPVALRFNPDVNPKTHPYISTGLKRNKFGLNRKEIVAIARSANEYPGVSLRGLSIHIGSQILSLSPFDEAFRKLTDLAIELDELLSEPLEFLDLGGGLGITYGREKPPTIENYCKTVLKHFGRKSRLYGRYRILLEPGRTLAGNAGVLLTRVLYRKKRDKKDFLVVDAAMNDLLRPSLYGSHHGIVALQERIEKAKRIRTDVVGPVCESSDCFASDRLLSSKLDSGDYVAILSAGAYGMSMSSSYNTRNRPAEVLVSKGVYRLIRKRETFEDQVRLEIGKGLS